MKTPRDILQRAMDRNIQFDLRQHSGGELMEPGDLADKIQDLRMERGWTQAQLGQRAQVARETISRIESTGLMTVATLTKLARAFGVELRVEFVGRA